MIAGYQCRPVFQYQFRPLMKDHRAADGGFCIILYENSILSFSTYDVNGAFLDELCFSLPLRIMPCFYSLLRNAGSWLGAWHSRQDLKPDSLHGTFMFCSRILPIFLLRTEFA